MSKNFVKKHVLLVVPILIFLVIRLMFGFNGLYGQDSHEYLRYAKTLRAYIIGGIFPGDYFWPVNYPLFGALFSLLLHDVILSLQLLSLICFIISLHLMRAILKLIFPREESVELYLFLTVIPAGYFMRGSLFCMSDMTAICFILFALYFFVVQWKKDKPFYFVLAALFSSLALFTRYASLGVTLFPLVGSFYLFIRKFDWRYFVFAILLCMVVAIPQFYIKQNGLEGFTNHFLVEEWSFRNFFSSRFNTLDGISENKVINLFYVLSSFVHPGYFIYGVFLIPFLKKGDFGFFSNIILFSALCYSIFLMGLPFQNMRFLMLTFPFIVIFFFPVFQRVLIKYKAKATYLIILLFCAQAATFLYSFRFFYLRNRLEQHIALVIKKYPSDKKLYAFSLDPALKSYDVQNPIKNLWVQRYDNFEKGSFVLFNPEGLQSQWQGKNPMINWDNLNKKHKLKVLENFDEGWNLYEIN